MKHLARVHAIYSGNVQGVGFRFTAERFASRLSITGFVKNLFNGNVEIICEGEKYKLEEFLEGIKQSMGPYIGDSNVKWEKYRGEFASFEIRF